MDLQALLSESDSSLEDGDFPKKRTGSASLSDEIDDDRSHHVDLERILREEEEDDDDDDDASYGHHMKGDSHPTNVSLSTISTRAHHYHLQEPELPELHDAGLGRGRDLVASMHSRTPEVSFVSSGRHRDLDSQLMSSSSPSRYTVSHNAQDWAALQQILGEDDEDEDPLPRQMYSSSRSNSKAKSRSNKTPDIDAILKAIDKEDDEVDARFPLPDLSRSPRRMEQGDEDEEENSMVRKLDKSYLSDHKEGSRSASSSPRRVVSNSKGRGALLQLTEPGLERRIDNGDPNTNPTNELASAKALAYAEAYEQRLLRPSQRDIISPLMVKRRLKPRIELGSRTQLQEKEQLMSSPQLAPASSVASHNTRFNFSGIMENKVMPGLTTQLQKNESQKSGGLPTAFAVNSKFIGIGTQHGIVLVFDLFEVLRQQLGRLSQPDGSWNAGQGGAVTSIDIAENGEALIAGYASGVVVLWDVIKGSLLKKIADTHPSPVTAVRFLPDHELKVVTVDTGGLVHKLNFSKTILWSTYSMETECLLDGTAGQILAINVLPPLSSVPQFAKDGQSSTLYSPFLKRLVLIGLSSERSSFAVAVEPTVSVLHRWARPDMDRIQSPGGPDLDEMSLDLPDDQPYLPCLSWGWALVSGGENALTPILARAWGCCVQLLRASFPLPNESEPTSLGQVQWPAFGIHDEFQVSAPIVALEWVGERSLVHLTLTNELVVVDTVMMTLVERLDFSGLKLVYAEFALSRSASAADREAPNGIGDDEPMSEAYCSTFLNSIRSSDNRLMILCQSQVRRISILGARQRMSGLEQDGEWLEALALALDHYENTIKSQEDRKRDPDGIRDISKHPEFVSTRRSEDEEWIAKLLIRYLNLAIDNAPDADDDFPSPSRSHSSNTSRKPDLAESHFQMLAGVCIEFCVVARRLDLLFGPIFRRFHTVGYLPIFLDVLEPYVLSDKLNYIAPEAMAYFVEHCKATNGIATVERCLLHMDVTIMDFDSILSLLRRNEMYSALCYVFTRGLDDFISPLEMMLDRVFDAADEGNVVERRRSDGAPQNAFEAIGYKIIIYLRYCFQGKNFPQGDKMKPVDKLKSVRRQLLQSLAKETYDSPRKSRASAVGGYRSLQFPYTRLLLMVDAKAILDTISLAIDSLDAEVSENIAFESIGGWEVEVGADHAGASANIGSDPSTDAVIPDRQQIISMLSSILLPGDGSAAPDIVGNPSKNKDSVDAFLDFIAKYLMQGVVRANKSVTFLILSRMVDRFAEASRPEERQLSQEQFIELLTVLPRNAYEPDDVLRLVQNSGMHRAALVLHQQAVSSWHDDRDEPSRRPYHLSCAIDCYLEDADPDFRKEVFSYTKKECANGGDRSNSSSLTETGPSSSLRAALCSKLRDLVDLDPVMSAQLVAELFIEELDEVIHVLCDGDENVSQFKFLNAVISGDLAKIDPVAGPVLTTNLTMDHHQMYLTLMAKLHPDMVYQYLSTHDHYRPEECLKLCQEFEIADASAYLLERMGNVSSALQLILQKLEGRLMSLKRTMRLLSTNDLRSSTSRWLMPEWNRDDADKLEQKKRQANEIESVKRILVVALELCERNSGSMARSEQGSQLWFNTLDRLINSKGFLRLSKEQPLHAKAMAGVLGELLQMTMQRMVSNVPLPDLVRKVTSDHSGSSLGELREMIGCLLGTFGFELQMSSKALKVMNYDVGSMESEARRLQMQGSCVKTVMNFPLSSQTLSGLSSGQYILIVGEMGNALIDNPDNVLLGNETNQVGLGAALDKLRSRRSQPFDQGRSALGHGPQGGLSLMSQSEQLFNSGESSEAAFVPRRVGTLGEAEHYGRFR